MEAASANCFTYQQLSRFAGNKMPSEEIRLFRKHLTDCEMCRFALMGFETNPFTQNDLNDIEARINQRIKFIDIESIKLLLLGLAAVLFIAAFYNFAESFGGKPLVLHDKQIAVPQPHQSGITDMPVLTEEKRVEKELTYFKPVRMADTRPETCVPESMKPIVSEIPIGPRDTIDYLPPVLNNDQVFIHHLKVAAYWNLYFKSGKTKATNFNNHIPSFNENRSNGNSLDDDKELSEALVSILEKGLLKFGQEKYVASINEFQRLLAASPNDINALFYLAMAYNKTADYERSAKMLNRVLNHIDKTFAEEAKWHLALVYIAADEAAKAEQLLEDIVSQKGFYAKNAEKKLLDIKNR